MNESMNVRMNEFQYIYFPQHLDAPRGPLLHMWTQGAHDLLISQLIDF